MESYVDKETPTDRNNGVRWRDAGLKLVDKTGVQCRVVSSVVEATGETGGHEWHPVQWDKTRQVCRIVRLVVEATGQTVGHEWYLVDTTTKQLF